MLSPVLEDYGPTVPTRMITNARNAMPIALFAQARPTSSALLAVIILTQQSSTIKTDTQPLAIPIAQADNTLMQLSLIYVCLVIQNAFFAKLDQLIAPNAH